MRRCLILGCSQAKRGDDTLLPAIERYNGPTFRVVRRFLADADSALQDVDIYVLSAQYGLIAATEYIANYDRRITEARADELRPQVLARMREILDQGCTEMFFSMGQLYLRALNGFEDWVTDSTQVTISRAATGKRLTELKRWLHRLPEGTLAAEPPKRQVRITGRAVLRGQQIEATPQDVLTLARQARVEGRGNPHNFRDWYVLVDEEKVSTKWLVSLLSGLNVSEFQASEARRVLGQLGVAVYHDE